MKLYLIHDTLPQASKVSIVRQPMAWKCTGAHKEVESLFPGLSDNLIFSRVYRWEHGAVQLQPGALLRQNSALRSLEHQCRNIYFAGDGLHRPSLEASFNSGIRAARRLIKRMGTHT